MIKYQLERIKDMYSGISDPDRLDGIPVVTVAQSDIEWLIEQAERVQELETTVDFYQSALRDADRRVQELESRIADDEHFVAEILEQNKRYREALKNIYELAEYDEYDNTLEQIVLEVEEALEGEK